MRSKLKVAVVSAAVVIASSGVVVALDLTPFKGSEDVAASYGQDPSQAMMNANTATRILESPLLKSAALPSELPQRFQFILAADLNKDRAELWFQQAGTSFVLCDTNSDAESACEQPHATLIREEKIDGRRVKIVHIARGSDLSGKPGDTTPFTAEIDQWLTTPIVRGEAPTWLKEIAAYQP